MAVEDRAESGIADKRPASCCYLHKFRLYETRSKFYMIGRDKSRTLWRVLKIDRSEVSELNIREDATTYTESECNELLKRIDEGNRSTGGLKFVTNCYGIVGFVKFLGPYYMLLITRRRQIGAIYGHAIYAVTKTEMIPLPNSNMAYSKNENRYKKLLCSVDLTKDFFFSYSYHVMRSLQKNISDGQTGQVLYESMFVWNEFLTRGIRNYLKNTLWTVALVYGFFKQAKLSVSGKIFRLTLIARRSRHYAGTRYLKRGVNEKGRVANDVETEQIVFEDIPGGTPTHICSVVQNRGSIPLFWSQETSRLNIKPDIVLHRKDKDYEATRLHFENLVRRYGNPIIILNLIKSEEKKPRESILRSEFANAIEFINKDLPNENRLKFLHWDLHKHCRSKAKGVLTLLGKVATNALNLTGFFLCEMTPTLGFEGSPRDPVIMKENVGLCLSNNLNNNCNNTDGDTVSGIGSPEDNMMEDSPQEEKMLKNGAQADNMVSSIISEQGTAENKDSYCGICLAKPIRFQNGVLRTNCIDCLDRTNVAQYAYGLAALGRQLHALHLIRMPRIDLDAPLADDLMSLYERMGDTLALQYGGSAAHNKIFSERRGHWKAAVQSQEFFRTLQRYYSNAYMDAEKQAAINLFLGHFQPQQGKPALWELDSDQHYNVGKSGNAFADEDFRSFIKRSLSDGNILCESNTPFSNGSISQSKPSTVSGRDEQEPGNCFSTPEISTCDSDISYSRCTPPLSGRQLFADSEHNFVYEHGESNFLDLDWLSSSGNSCDEEIYDRLNSSVENLSTENVNGINSDTTPLPGENGSSIKGKQTLEEEMAHDTPRTSAALNEFSDSFICWVTHGETLCY
ncbi:phosphoinositide phosphatase SAC2 isoform X1 [Canna indica]|uniref:Phosphoinositide phosphatase SAC2 isoform X1 n=1 Tax=Canna indica TaxID=4628 RepID=A0AAQ3QNY7_9LILI|nr:phosphoinositide phosphatase SAC2 isoform X1 [Canna indica]